MGYIKFGVLYSAMDEYIGPVEFARKAEEWGYNSYWVPDYVTHPPMDAFVLLAAVAQHTTTLKLGTAVVAVSFRSPFQLAKAALSVDVLSNGRLILGVGTGVVSRDFEVTQTDFHQRGRITDERLQILRRLFSEENVTHQGRYHQFSGLTMEPRPVHPSHTGRTGIPIWVAAVWRNGIAQGALKRIARYGDGFLPTDTSPEEYRKARESIRQYAISYGRDPEHMEWGMLFWTCLGAGKEEAQERAKAEIERRTGVPWNVEPDNGYVLGTPAECIETIERYLELGITHLVFDIVCEAPEILSQHEVFAKEVIPHFR
ncbi:MAG: LLM class flavin-dependent oxidoreductase [Dehalococcoidia bacterium]